MANLFINFGNALINIEVVTHVTEAAVGGVTQVTFHLSTGGPAVVVNGTRQAALAAMDEATLTVAQGRPRRRI